MTQYIPKSVVVAEIEKLKGQLLRGACSSQINMVTSCKEEAYNEVLSFLDTLEVKEVNRRKELSYEDYIRFFGEHPDFPDDWGFDEAWVFAKHFFELGMAVNNKAQKGE